ncbi:ribosome biogenesis protein YTM1 [Polyporus arcularius HHB13444]|uniref:Ribosome biogenesis protein YTM1 n=1 Tax=Polyporus arcularius HHB13444 TaxID=1314778 RepID=A0A5C3PF25_9APHY|nr:ribosome biogenesis protein YTM1 [Polyporus arcularius HHB13444]
MASTSTSEPTHPVVFTTQTPYALPSQKFMIPTSWKRYQLSQLVNKALSLPKPIPFEFLVQGEILRGTLAEWCAEKGVGEEETLEIEYFESVMPPQRMSTLPHEDWVSSISCQLPGYFLTASYDGAIRIFDYSQKLLHTTAPHSAPISSLCIVPEPSRADDSSHLLATASQDLTARLTRIDLSSPSSPKAHTLASLHLHTAPLSSVSASPSGAHILTSSWDGLIGVFDTSIPDADEVPADEVAGGERKKRRKVVQEDGSEAPRPKRKAPTTVLKSHTARVSRVVFGPEAKGASAYSCGFDSTVRTWDVENGVCTSTITASSKPFLDIALTANGHTALAASTDRTVSQYDLRAATTSATTPSVATLTHPATPSCIAVARPSASAPAVSTSASEHQLVTGAYDGVVRLWDLRSTRAAVAAFRAWESNAGTGPKKVLSVDWARGLVGVGGEGGVEVWKVGEGDRITTTA